MKRLKAYRGLSALFVIFLLIAGAVFYRPQFLQAGDTYNQSVGWVEGKTYILYYGTIVFTTDSTGNFYTKAIDVGEANDAVGSIRAITSNVAGTEDVNVNLEYNNNLTSAQFTSSSIDLLDQVGTTAKVDSVGDDPQFFQHRWVRIKADGQSGNPAATTLYWYLLVKKRAGAPEICAGAKTTS